MKSRNNPQLKLINVKTKSTINLLCQQINKTKQKNILSIKQKKYASQNCVYAQKYIDALKIIKSQFARID